MSLITIRKKSVALCSLLLQVCCFSVFLLTCPRALLSHLWGFTRAALELWLGSHRLVSHL